MSRRPEITEAIGSIDTDLIAPFLWNHDDLLKDFGIPYIIKSNKSIADDYKMFHQSSPANVCSLLHRAANQLRELSGCTGSRIYIVNAERRTIDCVSPTGETLRTWNLYEHESNYGTFALYVAQTNQPLLVNSDVYGDERFPEHTGWPDDRQLTACICMPVYTMDNECMAVCEFTHSGDGIFSENDMKVLMIVCGWLSTSLQQKQLGEVADEIERLCLKLVKVMDEFIAGCRTFPNAIDELMHMIKESISADDLTFYCMNFEEGSMKCTVYGEAKFAKPAQFVAKSLDYELSGVLLRTYTDMKPSICLAKRAGEERRTASPILSTFLYPIRRTGKSVALLYATSNTISVGGTTVFTNEQVVMVGEQFEECLSNLYEHERVRVSTEFLLASNKMYRSFLHNRTDKLLRYVAQPLPLPEEPMDLSAVPNLSSFAWYPAADMSQNEMIKLSFAMIMEQCDHTLIEPANLFLFIITIRKLHRPLVLHNFHHSFLCLHCVYCIMKRYGDRFTGIERLAMMVSSIAINTEHLGHSNAILRINRHPLTVLHKHGCMQQQQFHITQMVAKSTKLLVRLTEEQRVECIGYINKFMTTQSLQSSVRISRTLLGQNWRHFDWTDAGHRAALRDLISSAGRMAVMTKPNQENMRLVSLKQEEIFTEGDQLKETRLRPVPFFDRTAGWHLAEWFLGLVRFAYNCFEMLRSVMPETGEMFEMARLLEHTYQNIIDTRGTKVWKPADSYIRK